MKLKATKIEVGFVVVDPFTGHIKALVGGENQVFGRGLNHVTGIKRQPGSSFKPFVYATAMENGFNPGFSLLNQNSCPVKVGRRPKFTGGETLDIRLFIG